MNQKDWCEKVKRITNAPFESSLEGPLGYNHPNTEIDTYLLALLHIFAQHMQKFFLHFRSKSFRFLTFLASGVAGQI